MRDIAVIGCGFWGKNHARNLADIERLACVMDMDENRANAVARACHVPSYPTIARALAMQDIKGAVIATPPRTHYEIADKLNMPLLIEKPLSPTIGECQALQDKKVLVGYLERFNPVVQYAKRLVDSDAYGPLLHSEFHRENLLREEHRKDGIIMDTAVHDIDLALWFNGPAHKITCEKNDERTLASIMLNHGGAISIINTNWITNVKQRYFRLAFERARVTGNYITQELTIETKKQTIKPRLPYVEPLRNELEHFCRVVDGIEKPLVSAAEATEVTRIALECMKQEIAI